MSHVHSGTAAQAPSLVARLGRGSIPRPTPEAVDWADWGVVTRSKGFHVSRESNDGTRRDFLLNGVGEVKIFRVAALAIRACEQANFTARAERLAREPLLGGRP